LITTQDSLATLGYDKDANVTIIKGDILDAEHVRESMKGADIVIHAAAMIGVSNVINNHLKTMQTNIIGTSNVLAAAKEHEVSGRVVVFSTSEIFGSMAYKVTEEDPVRSGPPWESRWGYEISKVAGEHFAHAYHEECGMPIVCVRPFNVYGPGQTMNGANKMFIANALQNKDITVNGDGSPIRSWCYVDDFVECIIRCIENPNAIGESFNIGNAKTGITILGLAQQVVRLLGSDSKVLHGEALAQEIHLRMPCADKIKKLLDFEAMTDLEEGILKTAESVKVELGLEAAATV